MTVVKTNLYRIFISLIAIGWISANALVAQCSLNNGDNLQVQVSPGSCELTGAQLLANLKAGVCADADSISPSGPFVVNTTTPVEVFDDLNMSIENILVTPLPNEISALFCNNNINISLDQGCSVTINASHLLELSPVCYLNYTILVKDDQGITIGQGDSVNIFSPGSYSVSVQDPVSGNSCWGYVEIEDKFIYDVKCVPDTIPCYDNNDFKPDTIPGFGPEFPYVGEPAIFEETDLPNFYLVHTDNDCGIYYAFYVDQEVAECVGPYKKIIERHWGFEDHAGNLDTCVQKIYVEKTKLSDIDVDPFVANCISDFILLDGLGNPSPEETGYPEIKGTSYKADFCGNIKMIYTDTEFPLCGKSIKIVRDWVLIDWCTDSVKVFPQLILIEDTIPPSIDSILYDIHLQNDPFLCGVEDVQLVAPEYSDCGSDTAALEIQYEDYDFYGNKSILSNGSSLVIPSLTMHGTIDSFLVFYILTDDCGNIARDTIVIYVEDTEPPTAICDEYTAVSIGGNGLLQIAAKTFDNLSVDNCAIDTYKVRKLTGECFVEEEYADYIYFCCEEVGDSIMVQFQVTDFAGNANWCMVIVEVLDKFPPNITCPGNITIDCQADPQNLNLTGRATAIDNCDTTTITYTDITYLNDCGEGTINRIWKATDLGGFTKECTQIITVTEAEPFIMTLERWPSDTILNGCGLDLSPDVMGEPDISNSSCSNVAFTHDDAYFYTVEGACFKIVREWTVIDWCRYGQPGSGPSNGFWKKSQIIKQQNLQAPEFVDLPTDTTICLFGNDCIEAITIDIKAVDDCSQDHDLLWYMEFYNAGSLNTPIKTTTTNKITENLEPGEYVVIMRVADGCGNTNKDTLNVSIVDCEPPVVECPPFSPSVVLGSNGQSALWVSDFNLKATDNCTPANQVIFSFAPDTVINSLFFSCEDVANGISSDSFIRFYAIDEQGNSGFCEMSLEIKDNSSDLCEDMEIDSILVAGLILTEELGNVDDVRVQLNTGASTTSSLITDLTGTFAFREIEEGLNYTISLEKTGRIDDGITTFDLVLIAQHAVGLRPLDSPYKIIAADIDNSRNVSSIDLVWLRKIILGTTLVLPNGQKNWRFVDEAYKFPNPQRPFPFPEQIDISNINQSQLAKNFVAVKIGDVNGTNEVSSRAKSGTRSSQDLTLVVDNIEMKAGQTYRIPVRSEYQTDILGMQYAWEIEKEMISITGIESGAMELNGGNYVLPGQNGVNKLSWNLWNDPLEVEENDVLYYLLITARTDTDLHSSVRTNVEEFPSEVINGGMETGSIEFKFNNLGESPRLSDVLKVYNNRPNPFKDMTTLIFEINEPSDVRVEFFNLAGELLYSSNRNFEAGQNEWIITADDLGRNPGVILYSLSTGTKRVTRKLSLVK